VHALADEDTDQPLGANPPDDRGRERRSAASSRAGRPVGKLSRIDTEMFRALERVQQRMFLGAIALPSMLPGATDMAQLLARDVEAYGFGPIVDDA